MNMLKSDMIQKISRHIASLDFSQYADGIKTTPDRAFIEEFLNHFELASVGTPLLSNDANCKFLLTTEYLFWWDDCVEYNYHPINDVLIYYDEMFGTVAVSKKSDDTYMGAIADDDVPEDKCDEFAEAMQSLIDMILFLENN